MNTNHMFRETDIGDDPDTYLAAREHAIKGITPGTEKRIIWAGTPKAQTDLAVVYLHGFSATSEEIRPVPDLLAKALGANLHFTRLTGHGCDASAMGAACAGDWINDLAEALAVGRYIGREVIVLATSTGATLAAIAATDPELATGIKGIAMISPNFGLRHPAARMMTWPLVRYWGPVIAGRERGFTPQNEAHGTYWTTRYPSCAVLPMATLVSYARGLDYGRAMSPALMILSEADKVISPNAARGIASRWGGKMRVEMLQPEPGGDAYGHVPAGDILNPGGTEPVMKLLENWAKGLN